jgi:hypothetical protein
MAIGTITKPTALGSSADYNDANKRVRVRDVQLTSGANYTTGGETITAAAVGLNVDLRSDPDGARADHVRHDLADGRRTSTRRAARSSSSSTRPPRPRPRRTPTSPRSPSASSSSGGRNMATLTVTIRRRRQRRLRAPQAQPARSRRLVRVPDNVPTGASTSLTIDNAPSGGRRRCRSRAARTLVAVHRLMATLTITLPADAGGFLRSLSKRIQELSFDIPDQTPTGATNVLTIDNNPEHGHAQRPDHLRGLSDGEDKQ